MTPEYEIVLRLGAFAAVFAVVAGWERLRACQVQHERRRRRWLNNLALAAGNAVIVRALAPIAAVAAALAAERAGWGLLNATSLPAGLRIVVAVIALDFVIWLQHVVFHAVPCLWRLHRVHHADVDFDVTTGLRFHPIEAAVSMLIKAAAVLAIGAPVAGVIAFEILLNATSMFNHANARLPARLEPIVRSLVVTPDMHRIHHSVAFDEMNHNFGFNLSIWDRVFGTYRATPRGAHETMPVGLPGYRDDVRIVTFGAMLAFPFRAAAATYGFDKRRDANGA